MTSKSFSFLVDVSVNSKKKNHYKLDIRPRLYRRIGDGDKAEQMDSSYRTVISIFKCMDCCTRGKGYLNRLRSNHVKKNFFFLIIPYKTFFFHSVCVLLFYRGYADSTTTQNVYTMTNLGNDYWHRYSRARLSKASERSYDRNVCISRFRTGYAENSDHFGRHSYGMNNQVL